MRCLRIRLEDTHTHTHTPNTLIFTQDNLTPLALAESKGHRGVADILLRKPGTIKRDRKHTVYVTG